MLRLLQLEEIEGQLRETGWLATLQEQRSHEFPPLTLSWLKRLESSLEASGLVEAALIAGLRSGIASAAQGSVPPGLIARGEPTRSKVAAVVAGQALQRAAEIGAAIATGNRQRYNEAELVAQRLVAALRSLDVIIPDEFAGKHGEWLRAVRSIIATRGELEPAMVHLEGLVGSTDALVLLDRALAGSARWTPGVPVAGGAAEATLESTQTKGGAS